MSSELTHRRNAAQKITIFISLCVIIIKKKKKQQQQPKQTKTKANKENTVLMIWSQYAKTAPFRLKLQVYSFVSGVDITS